MNYIRTSRSPSPREIPFTRHPPKRTDENTDESREMAAQISAVDPVRYWPSGTRVGTRQRRFQELLRERLMGTKGTSSGTVGAPLKRKIVHWLWSSLILRSSLCLLGAPQASRYDSCYLQQFFRLSLLLFSFDRVFCSVSSHVLELSFGALYCSVLLS